MSETTVLLIGLAAFLTLAVGRLMRWQLLRQLAAAFTLVGLTALAKWGVGMAKAGGQWEDWAGVALLMAFGYLLIRGTVVVVFEWLLAYRFKLRMPRLARDVSALIMYLVVGAVILRSALGIDVKTLLGTAGVVTVVMGFALQETLGTLFAGLALAWEQRLGTGSWIEIEGVVGEIQELGWRSLVLRTRLGERVLFPNSVVGRARIKLFGEGEDAVAVPLSLGVAYSAPPDQVRDTLLRVAHDLPMVVADPAPRVLVREFADSAITYEARLWTKEPWRRGHLADDFYGRAYEALARAGMEIPFPQRTVHTAVERQGQDLPLLCKEALSRCVMFAGLPEEALAVLAGTASFLTFAPGEAVVREGEASRALYVIAKGEVMVVRGGQTVARVGEGEVFGEMAFLSGAPRAATVRAGTRLAVVEVDSRALGALLVERGDLAEELAERMAARQQELAAHDAAGAAGARRSLAGFLRERLLRLVSG